MQNGSVSDNAELIAAYSKAYTEALKNNDSEKYNSVFVSPNGTDLSDRLAQAVIDGKAPKNAQNSKKYNSAATQVREIVNEVGVRVGSERAYIYKAQKEAADYAVKNSAKTDNVSNTAKNITLTRVGDFYEAYGDEAAELAQKLNLKPTSKIVDGKKVQTVGFPAFGLESFQKSYGNDYNITVLDGAQEQDLNKYDEKTGNDGSAKGQTLSEINADNSAFINDNGNIRFNQLPIDYNNKNLRRGKFNIYIYKSNQSGIETVKGELVGKYGVYKNNQGKYSVSFLQTGMNVESFDKKTEAEQFAVYVNENASFYSPTFNERHKIVENDAFNQYKNDIKHILETKEYITVPQIKDGKVPFDTKGGLVEYLNAHKNDKIKVTFNNGKSEIRTIVSANTKTLKTLSPDGSANITDLKGVKTSETGFDIAYDTGVSVNFDLVNIGEAGMPESQKITLDMGDEARADLLNKKSVNVVSFDAEKAKTLGDVDFDALQKTLTRHAKPIIEKVAKDFGILNKTYSNPDIELDFEYSKGSLKESMNKQHTMYGDFVKMLSVFPDVIKNAVGVETHNDKYAGTTREDASLKQMYVLASALSDEAGIIPVKLEVKEFNDKANKLYLSVVLTKKESRYPHGNLEQSPLNTATPASTISIADLVGIVNPSEGDFLKYFPDSMLDSEQIAGKNKALAKDAEKIETLSEDKKSENFRKRLDEVGGASEKLPDGAFKNSERSTGANTRMAVIDRADAKYSLSNNTFDNENDTKKLFSVDDKTISDLNKQIDKWLAGNMSSDENFNFGNTPLVMRSVGADNLPIIMSQDVMVKINGEKHELSLENIRHIPEEISNPLMILRSSTVPNAFIVLTSQADLQGNPVIVALHLNKYYKHIKINRIASIYGKNGVSGFIREQFKLGNVKYLDKNKSQEWSQNRGLRLPKLADTNPDNNIILYKDDIVNMYNMQNDEKYSTESNNTFDNENDTKKLFSVDDKTIADLNKQIDKWLAGNIGENEYFGMGKTPVVLQKLGAHKLPVVMSQDVMIKITGGKHSISLDEIKSMPQAIANPIMVFKSATVDNAFVMLTTLNDNSGNDVIVAVHLNKKHNRINVNNIASVYGKNNVLHFVEAQFKLGNVKYLDKNKSQEWSTSRGLRLPKLVQSNPDNNIILYKDDIVNMYNMQNDEKYSTESEETSNDRNNLLSGNGGREFDEGTGKQAERISAYKQSLDGKTQAERKEAAREIFEKGHTQEVADGNHKYTLINPSGYNDDMRSIAAKAKEHGKEIGFFIGNAIRKFDGQRNFKIDGIWLSDNKFLIRYDGEHTPQALFNHETVHDEWNTERIQTAKEKILGDLSESEKEEILKTDRYKAYMFLYKGDTDMVWEEFVADVFAGMNDYSDDYIDIVADYWNGNETVDSYSPSRYNEIADAGGRNAEAVENFGISNDYISLRGGDLNESENTETLERNGVHGNNDSLWQQSDGSDKNYERLEGVKGTARINLEKQRGFVDWCGELQSDGTSSSRAQERNTGILRKISARRLSEFDTTGRELNAEVKKYFANTVFKNKNGELTPMFHATDNNFNTFKFGDFGFHIGSAEQAINRGGKYIKELYVNITNPLYIPVDRGIWTSLVVASEAKKQGVITQSEYDFISKTDGFHKKDYDSHANASLRKLLKTKGYDGIVYPNGFEGEGISAIAFDANQLKYVSNRAPSKASDIRYSLNGIDNDIEDAESIDTGGNEALLDNIGLGNEYSLNNYMPKIKLTKQEYALVSKAIMAKNAGKTGSELSPVDFVYATDEFYVYENHSIGEFSVINKYNVETEYERIDVLRELINDGIYGNTDRERLDRLIDDVRRGKGSHSRNNGRFENGRYAMADDRISGKQQRSNSIGYSTGIGKDNEVKHVLNSSKNDAADLFDEHRIESIEKHGAISNEYSLSGNNFDIPYNEKRQLDDYILRKNHSSDKLKKVDCKEIGNNFYVWKNNSKIDYDVVNMIEIDGNENLINDLREVIDNGTHGFTKQLSSTYEGRSGNGRGSDNSLNVVYQKYRTSTDENGGISSGQSERNQRGRSGKSSGNKQTKYALNSYETDAEGLTYESDPNEHSSKNDAADLFDERWIESVEKYGAIEKGENPVRDVDVPKKISENDVVSKFARTMIEAGVTPDDTVSEFEKRILDGTMTHEVITNKKAEKSAVDKIKEIGFKDALNEWNVLTENGKVGKKELALGMELYNQCVTNKDIKNAMKIAADLVAEATNAGQTLQACRMLKLMTPDGQLYYIEKSVKKMNEEFREKLGESFKDIKLDDKKLEAYLTEKDDVKRKAAYDEICQDIADQIPATLMDKWNSWRYLAMLGNPKTHIRNVGGNSAFWLAVRLKNYVGASIESAVRLDKSERTKSFTKSKASIEFAKKDFETMQGVLQGENAKYAITSDVDGKRTIFKTKLLEKLRTSNFDLLEREDMFFLKSHYVDTLARIITARNVDVNNIDAAILDNMRLYAVNEAQKATFRDANSISDALNAIQRKALSSDNKIKKAGGILLEGTMPFKKTPLNIAKQGVLYSPIGLLNGIYKGIKRINDGTAYSASEVIDDFAKGLTGLGIMLLGMLLSQLGVLVGGDDDSSKKQKFDKLVGKQSYALKFKNKSYSIDWAAPTVLPLFIGAELHKLTKDDFSFSDVTSAVSKLSEPLLELSVFSGINDVIENAQYNKTSALSSMLSGMAESYILQAFPTLLGQISRIIDKNKREYYYLDKKSNVPLFIQRLWGRAASKVPGLSYLFTKSVDNWGRTQTYGNLAERIFENTVSPGYFSEEKHTRADREIAKLYKKTGDNGVLPVTPPKYITIDGSRRDLSAGEYNKLRKLRGKKSLEMIHELISTAEYQNMPDNEKVKAIEKCYKKAGEYAKEKMFGDKTE